MRTQTVIWTALPNGRAANGRLRLSVFVSPRLWTDEGGLRPGLGQFPAWVTWPAQAITFQVRFGSGATAVTVPGVDVGPARRPDLWSALFDAQTFVRPHVFENLANVKKRSYPVRQALDVLRPAYAAATALSPTEHPTARDLYSVTDGPFAGRRPLLERLGTNRQFNRESYASYLYGYGEYIRPANRTNPDPVRVSVQTEYFYRRGDGDPPDLPVEIPDLDFHQMVASLGDYPELLTRLGVVRDLECELPPTFAESPTVVTIVPVGSTADTNLTPGTRCTIGTGEFRAAPRATDPDVVGGYLSVGPDDFDLFDVDVDSAHAKVLDLGFLCRINEETLDNVESGALPALKSAGISLTRLDRAVAVHDRTLRSRDLDGQGSAALLDAEDLVRGYAPDVWSEEQQRWYPLTARRGTYRFLNTGAVETYEDEATTETAAAARDGATSSSDLYLHESMIRWSGWSLGAPRPGQVITPLTSPVDPDAPGYGAPPTAVDPDAPVPLDARFTPVPGTLPRLRYGQGYRMRCRSVDLAGNRVEFDADAAPIAPIATDALRYRRLEPIDAPALALRRPTGPSESIERMVIRSNFDANPTASPERHVLPPKVSVEMLEASGVVDNGTGIDRTKYALLAALDAADLKQGAPVDPITGQPYFDTNAIAVRYGFDPLARGVSFTGLGAGPDPLKIGFGYSASRVWPDALPFRIRLVQGGGAPAFDGAARVLTVPMPKGTMRTVRYSSYVDAADLPKIDTLIDWAVEAVEAGEVLLPDGRGASALRAELEQLATQGRLVMLTPYRPLTLVHAVRQPLTAPRFGALEQLRQPGETFTRLIDGQLSYDPTSTARVDVVANWVEPIDDVTQPAPTNVPSTVTACTVSIPYGAEVGVYNRHVFGDTKHRLVNYSALATSRYTEYFAETVTRALTGTTTVALRVGGIMPLSDVVQSIPPAPDQQPVSYRRDVDYTIDPGTSRIARTATSTIPSGASVRVKFVPTPVTRASGEVAPPVSLHIPSSVIPVPPVPVEVVPTFAWAKQTSSTRVESKRLGGGVRVYLQRPWWNTGADEQLGVLLPRTSAEAEALTASVTRWGRDPTVLGGPTPTVLTAADFPRVVNVPPTDLGLVANPANRVLVAPHNVAFDTTRGLWYCDIELPPKTAYFPFLRLALARYQRYSLPGTELSNVVLADMTQLAPDRTATVIFDSANARQLRVTLYGQSYRWGRETAALRDRPGPGRVVVSVETRIPGLTGDLSWEPAAGVTDVVLSGVALSTGKPVTWTGDVTLPAARGSQPFRLVLREYERYAAGTATAQVPGRLVYVDAIEI